MGYSYLMFSSPGAEKKINEDVVGVYEIEGGLLAVLCDGIGGDNPGDLAARFAVKSAMQFFAASNDQDFLERIKLAIKDANNFVFSHIHANKHQRHMATTLELVYVKDHIAYYGHVGDSRIYHLKSKRLSQLTKDHSLVQKLLDEGLITHKQAATHPQKNVIVKAIGDNENVEPDLSKIRLLDPEGDKLFLCSDGVTNLVSDTELEEILILDDLEIIKERLKKLIKMRGAADDYSFIVIKHSK